MAAGIACVGMPLQWYRTVMGLPGSFLEMQRQATWFRVYSALFFKDMSPGHFSHAVGLSCSVYCHNRGCRTYLRGKEEPGPAETARGCTSALHSELAPVRIHGSSKCIANFVRQPGICQGPYLLFVSFIMARVTINQLPQRAFGSLDDVTSRVEYVVGLMPGTSPLFAAGG